MNKNVIKFPLKAGQVMKLRAEHRKMILTGSLASVLLMAIFINETLQIWTDSAVMNLSGRGIASVEDDVNYMRDTEWEHSLARRLAKDKEAAEPKSLDLASSASYNADLDRLAFVDLEGKYALRLENGKVREIEFASSGSELDRPKHVDAAAFLGQYKRLWAIPFKTAVNEGKGQIILKDESEKSVGRAKVSLDDRGRLIGLKVESL